MKIFPILKTERLTLRKLVNSDFKTFREIRIHTHPHEDDEQVFKMFSELDSNFQKGELIRRLI